MNPKFEPFFQTFMFPIGVQLRNRLVMAPMTNFSSNPDGTVTDDEVSYYARRSQGVGMVVSACAYVNKGGKGFPGQFGADTDEMIPSLAKVASAIKKGGAKAVIQLYHGGRMSPPELVPNGEIVSASAVAAEREGAPTPRELTEDEINTIIKDFGKATKRAIEAGFDGVEIHGANGYLLQQFFSPHSNRREDEWGGSVEKRMAFPLAIIDEVERVVAHHPEPFIVGYRFSPEEPETPGITMDDTLKFVDALASEGLDYIHVSQVDFWSKPRRGVDDSKSRNEWILEIVNKRVPVIGVGSVYKPEDAVKAFETGVDLLGLGRELIIDPDWVEKIQDERESEIETTLDLNAQERLVVPDPLWKGITSRPGWFPGV
jgi:2,4-dienoyl-CoA reductase-like NADH-dependent reductase (Old Yellow Enzyme family)